jgi:amino acid transporter
VSFSPSAGLPPLTEQELDALRQVGRRWAEGPPDRRPADGPLPVDPGLGRYRPGATPTRFSRFAQVAMFQAEAPDELVATGPEPPGSPVARAFTRARRILLGPRLNSSAVVQERMPKLIALPVLSSDVLSSVAYGPEAMFTVLVLAGSGVLGLSLPIGAVLVLMMAALGLSYRQTIRAYPHGAGSYIVASDNLGPRLGLAAAAGLMMDYILTVSVSVAAGVDAVTSAEPRLAPFTVEFGVLVIALLLAGNLRGVRAAGRLFAAPTYAFFLAIALLLAFGLAQLAQRGFAATPPPRVAPAEGLGVLLVLRAFASGATSMTGTEAVSNAVPVFRPEEWRNARATLTVMIGLLVLMFTGLVLLFHLDGLVPRPSQTMLSQLGRLAFHNPVLYGYLQATTALVLLLAANTAFNDFPRLLYFMARDRYAPRAFLHLGDRLAFSNGIFALAVVAAVIFVAFHGRTQALIPLYAVGVFLAFTLSQAGMTVHWARHRGPRWRQSLVINAAGGFMSGLVLLIGAATKFVEGAWVVVLALPLLILLSLRIRRHYETVNAALALRPDAAPADGGRGQEMAQRPQDVQNLCVVPVVRLDLAGTRALAYAVSLRQPVLAVHVSPDEEEDDRFRRQWQTWGDQVELEIIVAPHRTIVPTLAHYIEALHAVRPDVTLTVIVPEIVVKRWWHQTLHSHTRQRLRRALGGLPGIVITSVPVHIPPKRAHRSS